jgi:excisionase family DNA binding protein
LTVQPVPPVLSLPQTQRLLGISKKLLQDLMHSGELPTIKLGDRRRVISGEALVAYLRRKQDATGRGQV